MVVPRCWLLVAHKQGTWEVQWRWHPAAGYAPHMAKSIRPDLSLVQTALGGRFGGERDPACSSQLILTSARRRSAVFYINRPNRFQKQIEAPQGHFEA